MIVVLTKNLTTRMKKQQQLTCPTQRTGGPYPMKDNTYIFMGTMLGRSLK